MEDMKNKSITDAYNEMYHAPEHIVEEAKGTSIYMESLISCVEKPSINESGFTSIDSVYESMLVESLEEEYVSSHKTLEEAYSKTINTEEPTIQQTFMEWSLSEEDMEPRYAKK